MSEEIKYEIFYSNKRNIMALLIVMLTMIGFIWVSLGIPGIIYNALFILFLVLFLSISFSLLLIVMLILHLPFHTFLFIFSDKGFKIIVQDVLYFKYDWKKIKKIEIKRVMYGDDEGGKIYDMEVTLHTQEGGMKRFYIRKILHNKKRAEEAITSIKYFANLKEIEIFIDPTKEHISYKNAVPSNIIERFDRDIKKHIKRSIKNKKRTKSL